MNDVRAGNADSEHPPLGEVLEALGLEVSALGEFALQFQTALSPALLRVANDPECHRNVQTLDLLTQRLAALSTYVLDISRGLPGEWRVNSGRALRNISLSDLAYRLQGAPLPEREEEQSGALELF